MSLVHIYVRKQKAIIPTVAQTEAGFFIDTEPVQVVRITEIEKLKSSLLAALTRENPLVPTPERVTEPGSIILETIGIRRWEAFERSAVLYTVHSGPGGSTVYITGRGPDGMWLKQEGNQKGYKPGVPLTEIVDAIIEDVYGRADLNEPEPSLPMLLPPAES